MTHERLLQIYLNDHLAGAVAGEELCRRALSNNRRSPLGSYLATLHKEIDADRRLLETVMERLRLRKDPVKRAAAWASEKVGRLKLNGSLFRYSDLSRLLELEGLILGVNGKLGLWRSLKNLQHTDARLSEYDFDASIGRAENQISNLERHRTDSAAKAFGHTRE